MVSPVFGIAIDHFRTEDDPARRRWFYMAAGLTLWVAWVAVTGIGYAFGGLPSVPVLSLLGPLVILSLALRAVRDIPTVAALMVASTTIAVVGFGACRTTSGTVAAGITGIATGASWSVEWLTGASRARRWSPGDERVDHPLWWASTLTLALRAGPSGLPIGGRAKGSGVRAGTPTCFDISGVDGCPCQPQRRRPVHDVGRTPGAGLQWPSPSLWLSGPVRWRPPWPPARPAFLLATMALG